MVPVPRTVVFALFAGFVLLAVGCESNNKSKIVGKWRVTNAPGAEVPVPAGVDAGTYYEFAADGTFRVYAVVGSEQIDGTKGKYSLGAGDTVSFSDINPAIEGKTRSREKITVSGDNMTIVGNPTLTLTRAK